MGSRENQPIVKFLKTSRALIIDSASESRGAIRRILCGLGLPTSQVDAAESVEEALEMMKSLRPNVIVTEMTIAGRSGFELLERFRKNFPSTLQGVFVFITAKHSPIVNSIALEGEVDGLVVKPFNVATMEQVLIDACRPKGLRPSYLVSIENAKIEFREGNFDEAIHLLNDSLFQDSKPVAAYATLGQFYFSLGEMEKSQEAFEAGLKLNPTHYQSLLGLFDVFLKQKKYREAYRISSAITKSDAFPMHRIPDFLQVSIQNEKFYDALVFFDILAAYDNPTESVVAYTSAAMVVCAKKLIREHEAGRGLEILKKAQFLSRNRDKIQIEIISALYLCKMEEEADQFLKRVPEEIRNSSDMQVMRMEHFLSQGQVDRMMRIGDELIKANARNCRLYEIMIEQSKRLRRPVSAIDSIVSRAVEFFPEKRESFEQLIKDYQPDAHSD